MTLTAYCEAWEDFVGLLKKCREDGPVVLTDKGNAIQDPVYGLKNRAAERMVKAASHFGLSPVARRKVELTEKDGVDAFTEFMRGGENEEAARRTTPRCEDGASPSGR